MSMRTTVLMLAMGVALMGNSLGGVLGPIAFGATVEAAGWATAGCLVAGVCAVGMVAGWSVNVR